MNPEAVAFLVGFVLLALALMIGREAKQHPVPGQVIYGVEDAVDHICARLDSSLGLRRSDVKLIIEWEVFYLQGLAQERRWEPVETVAGGFGPAVDYIGAQIAETHKLSYPRAHLEQVLALEAEYLVSIGAVGDPVGPMIGDPPAPDPI